MRQSIGTSFRVPRYPCSISDAAEDVPSGAPALTEDDYGDRVWGTRLHEHFGVPPYWL